jgi:hypothetical protein
MLRYVVYIYIEVGSAAIRITDDSCVTDYFFCSKLKLLI